MHLQHSTTGKRLLALSLSMLFFLNFFLSGCCYPSFASSNTNESALSFEDFCNELFCSEVSSNTINLHFTLSHPETYHITNPSITLGEISHTATETTNASMENTLTVLKQFPYETLNKKEQLTYDVLYDYLTHQLSETDFYLYNEYLSPSSGVPSQLPILYEEYRFCDESDVKDYLNLLPLTKSYFEDIIAFEQEKANAGFFMPDTACDNLIAQCTNFTSDKENHYLIKTFNKKIDGLTELDTSAKEAYKRENKKQMEEYVFPAFDELSLALSKLKGCGKNDNGLCFFDKGKKYYEYLVYYNTGSDKSIKDIKSMIGKKRLSDLETAAKLTQNHPNLWEQCDHFSLSDTDAVSILNTLQQKMALQFPSAPKTNFTVGYVDKCMEEYLAPAYYITAPLDDYENNSIFINQAGDTSTIRYFTTLAHEGFPGHLYQTVMSYELGLPEVRCILNYPGYVEGWATYVEMLSYQYANVSSDMATLMEVNQSALLSLYASTDIGIHYDGWTLSDTIKFWKEYGVTDEASVAEIYQYILLEPANYLKYYVGYLEFLELKEFAKEMFQDAYSDINFHKAVLAIGPAPFSIIKKYLPDYYPLEQ